MDNSILSRVNKATHTILWKNNTAMWINQPIWVFYNNFRQQVVIIFHVRGCCRIFKYCVKYFLYWRFTDVSVILLLTFYFNSISLFLSLPLSVSISSPHVLSFCFIFSLSFSLFTSFFSFINAARIWDYVIPLFPWSWCPGKIWRRLGWRSYARQGFLFVRALLFYHIQIILYLLSCHHKIKDGINLNFWATRHSSLLFIIIFFSH